MPAWDYDAWAQHVQDQHDDGTLSMNPRLGPGGAWQRDTYKPIVRMLNRDSIAFHVHNDLFPKLEGIERRVRLTEICFAVSVDTIDIESTIPQWKDPEILSGYNFHAFQTMYVRLTYPQGQASDVVHIDDVTSWKKALLGMLKDVESELPPKQTRPAIGNPAEITRWMTRKPAWRITDEICFAYKPDDNIMDIPFPAVHSWTAREFESYANFVKGVQNPMYWFLYGDETKTNPNPQQWAKDRLASTHKKLYRDTPAEMIQDGIGANLNWFEVNVLSAKFVPIDYESMANADSGGGGAAKGDTDTNAYFDRPFAVNV